MFGLFNKKKKIEPKKEVDLQSKIDEMNKKNLETITKANEEKKNENPVPTDRENLGFISAKYESLGKVNTISTGRNDPGGKSYGPYQLASKTGTLARYIQSSKFKNRFQGVEIASKEFDKIWLEICDEDPKGFALDQKQFIIRTHYLPAANHAHKAGFNMRNDAVQEAIYSMSVQHGQFRVIINRSDSSGNSLRQVNSLYEQRKKYVSGLTQLPKVTKDAILSRFERELKDVLKLI
jgi:hypothetical protein